MATILHPIRSAVASIYDLGAAPSAQTSSPTTNNTLPITNATSLSEFSYGLNGVNIELDNQSSQALYVCVGIIFILITLLRLMQRGNAHLRQLSTYGSHEKQLYWTRDQSWLWSFVKKHIIYAPIRNVRHNKEIQLSRAFNIGTLPGRPHLVLLFIFLISQVTFMSLLKYDQVREATIAELRGRSGHLAVMNMIALFILAGRNNPFIRILRISFDTFNLFHRWIGRMIICEALIHVAAWTTVKVAVSDWRTASMAMIHEPFLAWGLGAAIAMFFLLIHSPSPIRHAFYETFLLTHQVMAFVALLGIFYHAKIGVLPQFGYVVVLILLWTADRVSRFCRILYANCTRKNGFTRAVVEALPAGACRVTFFTPRPIVPRAGSHIYVYFPRVAFWQSHPFSVAWTNSTEDLVVSPDDVEKGETPQVTATSISLIISARTGMTKRLHNLAMKANGKRMSISGFIEGPYGSLESLHSYGTVVLFAGGVGITHHLIQVRDLVKGYANKTISTQKIALIWTIRDEHSLEWVRTWMDEILGLPGRRDILFMKVYVTKSNNPNLQSGSDRVQLSFGRPKIEDIIQSEFRDRIGAMCVSVCGPGALADDVRCATRSVVDQGKVDFFEEAFTW